VSVHLIIFTAWRLPVISSGTGKHTVLLQCSLKPFKLQSNTLRK